MSLRLPNSPFRFGHLLLLLALAGSAAAQVDIEASHSAASLRGVDVAAPGVVWASGSEGTVLRSEDGGYLWQPCTVPPGAAKLDFRGVQALSAQTAVIMSSGPGNESKIFKTNDGCQTWKLVFEDPDATGFFDSIRKVTERQMYLLGDPVDGKFSMFYSPDGGSTWYIADDPGLEANDGAGAFAASNSSLVNVGNVLFAGAGGLGGAAVYSTYSKCPPAAGNAGIAAASKPETQSCPIAWVRAKVPMAGGSAGSGVFSVAGRTAGDSLGRLHTVLVAVGGDYEKPDASAGTAAFSIDGGKRWSAAATLPHGYRSAVAYDSSAQAWLAVGPNGMDVSFDDGKNWRPVTPTLGAPAGVDKGWNAISLPYLVGAKGRIGKLRPEVFHR